MTPEQLKECREAFEGNGNYNNERYATGEYKNAERELLWQYFLKGVTWNARSNHIREATKKVECQDALCTKGDCKTHNFLLQPQGLNMHLPSMPYILSNNTSGKPIEEKKMQYTYFVFYESGNDRFNWEVKTDDLIKCLEDIRNVENFITYKTKRHCVIANYILLNAKEV